VQAQRQERSYQGQRAGGINNGGGRSFHPQQAGRYRYPNGYSYQRWSVGLMLPSIFWGSSNYYNDYDAIGVGPPPSGYRWVRYGPDLLLINRRTGRIARVIHGAFY
jgi:Ni/Co efflux regulator RcnB